MNDFYLFDYVSRHLLLNNPDLECLKFELDQLVYYYGDQFRLPRERRRSRDFRRLIGKWRDRLAVIQKNRTCPRDDGRKPILSNAYFSLNQEIEKLGYRVTRPPWNIQGYGDVLYDSSHYALLEEIKQFFQTADFRDYLSDGFQDVFSRFREATKGLFMNSHIAALVVPNDINFYENLSIRIFRELGKPSFVFLHGLPGRYNAIDENRADYLLVWGERIKEHYVKAGFDAGKIFVTGHPDYPGIGDGSLRFDLSRILVITKSMNGAQHSDKVRLTDRGNLILYLLSVQQVLQGLGVKQVRFRPHPSENAKWYLKFIDPSFYRVDRLPLRDSLMESSLVIGPTSTVFLESLLNNVNYICYEPSINGVDMTNFELVPPFDGTDAQFPVAMTEEELKRIVSDRVTVDRRIISGYIKTPFDMSCLNPLVR